MARFSCPVDVSWVSYKTCLNSNLVKFEQKGHVILPRTGKKTSDVRVLQVDAIVEVCTAPIESEIYIWENKLMQNRPPIQNKISLWYTLSETVSGRLSSVRMVSS